MKYIKLVIVTLLAVIVLAGCETDINESVDKAEEMRSVASGYFAEIGALFESSSNGGNEGVSNAEASETDTDNPFSSLQKGKVDYIVDGDTVDVIIENRGLKEKNGGLKEKVRIRFILINTPESTGDYKHNPQPYGVEASNFTKMLLKDKTVWLEYDVEQVDRYGRTLAYVWLDSVNYEYEGVQYQSSNVMINELLLQHGLAHVAVYKPNVRYKNKFYELEKQAKDSRLGMWN